MPFAPSFRGRAAYAVIPITVLGGLSYVAQSAQTERTFPAHDNPHIVISNASVVSIITWDKKEVSIAAEVPGGALRTEELGVKADENKLDISCFPSTPDRRISLTLRAPTRGAVDIKAFGNTVQVRDATPPGYKATRGQIQANGSSSQAADRPGPIIVFISKELVHISAPDSSALDMRGTLRAAARRQLRLGSVVEMGIGRSLMGNGPPYIKVTAPTTPVAITLGAIEQPTKALTLAAQTIARRAGSMGNALRRSHPQLIRPQRNQTTPVRSPDDGALKLETHLVNLNVSATDREGRAIPGLKQDDFSVQEDGVPQRITFFSPEQSPFNLVLLLDLSGSMRDEIDLIRETADHFVDVINPQDSVAIVTFTTDVMVVSHLTKDRDDLRDSIDMMLAPAGGTSFYDALGYALVEVLRKVRRQRNAIIAITDGEDNALQAQLVGGLRPIGASSTAGSFLTFEELLDGAMEADALIYPIHLNPAPPQQADLSARPPSTQIIERNLRIQAAVTEIAKKQLQSLADASGGRLYHADRIEDLKGVFEQVAAELRTVYSMAYSPTNLDFDGRFRRVRVQVKRPDVVTRTRPGYYGR